MPNDGARPPTSGEREAVAEVRWRPPDGRRLLQLALATVWLIDGVLQLQPSMFTPGSDGLSAMLGGTAAGNPHAVAQSITWNASIVDHHAVATNTAFALIQILIGLGIAWRPSVKVALGASIVWSLGVWWFGEGLGGVLHGAGTPVGGGPGAVLFYALLAVLLWPTDRDAETPSFAAARAVGLTAAKAIWAVVWVGMALLALIGAGRSPQGIHDVIAAYSGQPGWLTAIDRHAGSLVANRGLTVAVVSAIIFLLVAAGPYLPVTATRVVLVTTIVIATVIWVVGENFGGILAGGATDPNSGPPLILLALAYWPVQPKAVPGTDVPGDTAETSLPIEVA